MTATSPGFPIVWVRPVLWVRFHEDTHIDWTAIDFKSVSECGHGNTICNHCFPLWARDSEFAFGPPDDLVLL